MSNHAWGSDDELLAELKEALNSPPPEPEGTLQLEKSLYTWLTIDAELATLTHDSNVATPDMVMRSETATLRTMTFDAAGLTIEVGITSHGLVGQLVPPGPGVAWLRTTDGSTVPVDINNLGCFTIEFRPAEPFRIACRTTAGLRVMTDWITS